MTRFNLPPDELLAMSEIAPMADIRTYMNGILVELTSKAVKLIATDGHILGILNATTTDLQFDKPVSFTLPVHDVLPLLKHKSVLWASVEFMDGQIEVQTVLGKKTVATVEGQFPDYRRVLPKKPVEQGYFAVDASLLAVFCKVAKHLGRKDRGINLRFYGKDMPAAVSIAGSEQFYGVIMPMTYEQTDRPAWLEAA